jgi:hypothetical protein
MAPKKRKSKDTGSRRPKKSKRSKKSKSLAIDDARSSHVQGAHFTTESVLADLGKLTFTPSQDPRTVIDEVGREIFKGMKPGPCLLGNKEEEAELYARKAEPQPGIYTSHRTQNLNNGRQY